MMKETIESALRCFNERKFEQSLDLFKAALESDEDNPGLYNNIGLCYFNSGSLQEAGKYYEKALALNPGAVETYVNLTDLYFKENRLLDAIELLQKGVANIPQSVILKHYLARVYMEDSRRDLAVELLCEVLDESDENYDAHWDLGRVLFEMGDYGNAAEHFEKVVNFIDTNELIYYQTAQAYEFSDETDKAISNYMKAVCINEKFHPAYKKLGLLFLSQEKKDQAKTFFKDYLELDVPDEEKETVSKILAQL